MSDFDLEHSEYVCIEVEKMILSEAAIRLGQASINHFVGGVEKQFVNLKTYMDNFGEVIDLMPAEFPLSVLRQRNDGRMLWTVSATRCRHPTELATVNNSTAGRSRDRNFAALATIIRLYLQDILEDDQEPQAA